MFCGTFIFFSFISLCTGILQVCCPYHHRHTLSMLSSSTENKPAMSRLHPHLPSSCLYCCSYDWPSSQLTLSKCPPPLSTTSTHVLYVCTISIRWLWQKRFLKFSGRSFLAVVCLFMKLRCKNHLGLLTWFISNNIVGNVAAPYCVNEIGVVLSCS